MASRRRAMVLWLLTLWPLKKLTRVSCRARLAASSVGQRSRNAAKTGVSLSRNQPRICGKYPFKALVSRLVSGDAIIDERSSQLDHSPEAAHVGTFGLQAGQLLRVPKQQL